MNNEKNRPKMLVYIYGQSVSQSVILFVCCFNTRPYFLIVSLFYCFLISIVIWLTLCLTNVAFIAHHRRLLHFDKLLFFLSFFFTKVGNSYEMTIIIVYFHSYQQNNKWTMKNQTKQNRHNTDREWERERMEHDRIGQSFIHFVN